MQTMSNLMFQIKKNVDIKTTQKKPREAVIFNNGFIIFDINGNYYAGKTAQLFKRLNGKVSNSEQITILKKIGINITNENDPKIKQLRENII
jgi:hypothetical protein